MKTHPRRVLPFLALAVVCVSVHAQTQHPAYEVLRATRNVPIDGSWGEGVWASAPTIGPFTNNRDGSSSSIRTEAKILYDDKFIYFAFRNTDTNIWATMKKRDAHLWEEEVDEVFVQASTKSTNYIELEINPLGTMFDAYLLDVRKPLHYESWNSQNLRSGAKVEGTVDGKPGDREWTSVIALPLEDVVTAPHIPPRPGDRWRINLYRIERLPADAKLAWSPTFADFHVPARFGEIVFSHRTAP